ncbi:MAG: hypothetical protein ABIR03_14210 [Ginsengibacter sp.]
MIVYPADGIFESLCQIGSCQHRRGAAKRNGIHQWPVPTCGLYKYLLAIVQITEEFFISKPVSRELRFSPNSRLSKKKRNEEMNP